MNALNSVAIYIFQKFFHWLVSLCNKILEGKFFIAMGAGHICFQAGAFNIQRLAAFKAGQACPGLAWRKISHFKIPPVYCGFVSRL